MNFEMYQPLLLTFKLMLAEAVWKVSPIKDPTSHSHWPLSWSSNPTISRPHSSSKASSLCLSRPDSANTPLLSVYTWPYGVFQRHRIGFDDEEQINEMLESMEPTNWVAAGVTCNSAWTDPTWKRQIVWVTKGVHNYKQYYYSTEYI